MPRGGAGRLVVRRVGDGLPSATRCMRAVKTRRRVQRRCVTANICFTCLGSRRRVRAMKAIRHVMISASLAANAGACRRRSSGSGAACILLVIG